MSINDDRWVDLKELAKIASMSKRTLLKWIREDGMPHYRRGRSGKVTVLLSEFHAWMQVKRRQMEAIDPVAREIYEKITGEPAPEYWPRCVALPRTKRRLSSAEIETADEPNKSPRKQRP